MGTLVAFQQSASSDSPGISDNLVLDQFTIPIGDWGEQIVRWIDTQMAHKLGFDLLAVIEWPFKFLFRTLVKSGDHHPWWEITDMPWWAVCAIFFFLGTAFRNVKIGLFAAGALALCGMLANEIWEDVALTLGMIIVAVFLCALIGIPVGVLCGRIDGVWAAVRPVLDAMQVVHSFVYMLPFVFFFGIGFEAATMVTMVFALPPLIRLTNLGIRQVPEDVVEASRAYGAPEWRVLTDVQFPLARPAIMTGLNQTLLLSISMLGIAAIMGAAGLGLLILRAVQNLDVALGVNGGLALFIVAVVLDRISQTQDSDGMNLFVRIRRAWVARSNPESLLPDKDKEAIAIAGVDSAGSIASLTPRERMGAIVAAVGATVSTLSLFLVWGSNAGAISSWSRRLDESLVDSSFNGLATEGGSWYGLWTLAFAATILLSVGVSLTRPGKVGRWLGPDGATLCAISTVVLPIGFLVVNRPQAADEFGLGSGAWVALLGGIIATVGALFWLFDAQYTARTPLPHKVNIVRVVLASGCVLWSVFAGFSAWTFDQRQDVVVTPEIQAQLDEVRAKEASGELPQAEAGAEISRIFATAQRDRIIYDGFNTYGPGLAPVGIVIAGLGLFTIIPASGLLGLNDSRRWRWSVITAGIGIGMMSYSAAWVVSLVRATDPNFVSGAGAFLYFAAGSILTMTSRSVMAVFSRARVFAEDAETFDNASTKTVSDKVTITA